MDEEEVQYQEEEEVQGEEEEEIDEEFERSDNSVGGGEGGATMEKTLYDEEGNEISFVFDKVYMVRTLNVNRRWKR
ncbi:hypothetical protein Pmani_027020 [Petrolisthes manimaculis]|uniref:Uncharacterized protein n=1 Tax=Petrolisthes manimaculis TaxID=1843537 RepID=A0AAE1P4W0_9EUCA|nr:hypothetical protein Pmani_027020 [Petrolisthes manimaculis]